MVPSGHLLGNLIMVPKQAPTMGEPVPPNTFMSCAFISATLIPDLQFDPFGVRLLPVSFFLREPCRTAGCNMYPLQPPSPFKDILVMITADTSNIIC